MSVLDEGRASNLIALAEKRLGASPSPAERKILRESASSSDPQIPTNPQSRTPIHPGFLRWLATDNEAADWIDPKGIRIVSAVIQGQLDLNFCRITPMLVFHDCRFQEDLLVLHSELRGLGIYNSAVSGGIIGHGATIHGPLFLGDGIQASGTIDFHSAQIEGNVQCAGAFLPAQGSALSFESATIQGDLVLTKTFRSCGEIRLLGTEIQGDFDCRNATLNAVSGSNALSLDRATIRGNAMLSGLVSSGTCSLAGIEIEGELNCQGAMWGVLGTALVLDGATVRGGVHLQGSKSGGAHRFVGAQIVGGVNCQGAVLAAGEALALDRTRIDGTLFLSKLKSPGRIRVSNSEIEHNLDCRGSLISELYCVNMRLRGDLIWTSILNPEQAQLTLTGASIGNLRDDRQSWPSNGHLLLDGCVYDKLHLHPAASVEHLAISHLSDAVAVGSQERLIWLDRQKSFARQPYSQLAKALRDVGDIGGWQDVCCERERRTWEIRRSRSSEGGAVGWFKYLPGKLVASLCDLFLRATIGYGYKSMRAIVGLFILFFVGAGMYFAGFEVGSIVPTESKNYTQFIQARTVLPGYGQFHVWAYSAENSFPLIKLGVHDQWTPSPDIQAASGLGAGWVNGALRIVASPQVLRWFQWLQILFGWLLTTFFVAGITGLIRKE